MNVSVILYKSKTLANGDHPIMLRVTHNRKRKYISLGISCIEKQWDFKKNRPKRSHTQSAFFNAIISRKINEYEEKILESKLDKLEITSSSLIKQIENNITTAVVFEYYDIIINELIDSGRIGNANVYKDSKNALMKFIDNKDLLFTDINYSFLSNYEAKLRQKGLKDTSMSVYFRTLRSLFNKAIKTNNVRSDHYPFNEFDISKFKLQTKKRALTKKEIQNIISLNIDIDSDLFDCRCYFLFSYYGKGINFMDIAKLKWEDITNGRIAYTRSKTNHKIEFKIMDPMKEVLNHFSPFTSDSKKNYIFPILNRNVHKTPTQIDNRVHKLITQVNKGLKEIGILAKIEIPLTTYVARHTFATVLKNSKVPIAMISEAMGHKTEQITNTYLKSFEDKEMDDAMENLL